MTWLVEGDRPGDLTPDAQQALAQSLGGFLHELHDIDVTGMPVGPGHWGYRCGEPVTAAADQSAEWAAQALSDVFDPAAVREAWRRVRQVPPMSTSPCLVHADLSAENLLVHDDGQLARV